MPRDSLNISTTQQRQIIDITDLVQAKVRAMGVAQGIACISVAHCTCAIYVNENEAGLVADTLRLIIAASRGDWHHDSIDDNAAAHLSATLLGSSVTLPITAGALEFGTWQRLMFVELDGPRSRGLTIQVVADK
jgi:secondary thiamine-phosphate synthase enzyme